MAPSSGRRGNDVPAGSFSLPDLHGFLSDRETSLARTPLLNQHWAAVPEEIQTIPLRDGGANYPGRAQFGVRWNRNARRVEYALMFYDGFHYLPLIEPELLPAPVEIRLRRLYSALRQYGGDLTVPLPWFTVKTEFRSRTASADEYVSSLLYVVQLEPLVGGVVFRPGLCGRSGDGAAQSAGSAPERGGGNGRAAERRWRVGEGRVLGAAESSLACHGIVHVDRWLGPGLHRAIRTEFVRAAGVAVQRLKRRRRSYWPSAEKASKTLPGEPPKKP
jgi:hypothetical protein